MRKASERFARLTEQALGKTTTAEKPKARRSSVLDKRQDAVAAAASGRVRTIKVFGHDPARIRPWAGHNRDYSALSKERCSDLIEGFRRADQQFPAIVRAVKDSDEFDYEFICGARRHWTASYLKRDLIVEVRNLDDRDAFLLQDIENRDREDISDYERACDYSRALPVYFDDNKSHMAEQLQIDQGNFTRFLALADMPKEIVQAYADVRELLVHHGTQYTKYLKDPDAKKRVLNAARKLKGQGATGKSVIAALRQAATGDVKPTTKPTPQKRTKQGMLSIRKGRAGEYTVSFKIPTTDRQKSLLELRRDFLTMIDQLGDEKEAENTAKGTLETI